MTYSLRPNWHDDVGPLSLRTPVDPAPARVRWSELFAAGLGHAHEDSIDRLNGSSKPYGGTWGSSNPAESGGSGIVPLYTYDDLDAVVVAEKAQRANPFQPDDEHSLRRTRWPMTGWDMTHEPYFARGIVRLDNEIVVGRMGLDGPVHLDDPGDIPSNLLSLHAQAHNRPGLGLPWNCRAYGEAAYLRAMRHKCDRTVTSSSSSAWGSIYLEASELCAVPGTGQQGNWQGDTGQPFDFNAIGQTYSFHEGLKIMGTLALCRRLGRPVPTWVRHLMDALASMPPMDYDGVRSMPSYWRTVAGVAVPEQRLDQHGDPAFGWWSTNCVSLASLLPGERNIWLDRALLYGPTKAVDHQSRVFTAAYRGATL